MRDPYEILGISRKADEAEVKKAFRTLAKKHHPDAHGNDPKAVKKFQELSAAYEVLGDKEKRLQFDRGEIDATGHPKSPSPGGGPGPGRGFEGFRHGGGKGRPQGFEFQWGAGQGPEEGQRVEDLFADLLGGGGRRRAKAQKGLDVLLHASVTLQEAAQGARRRFVLSDGRQLEVHIPAGVKDGQQIRLKEQGAPGERGGPAGDALISVNLSPHAYFERDGRDLRMDLPITLREAAIGAKVPVPTLTGPVSLNLAANSNSGKVLRLKGKGLPGAAGEEPGDLYVRLVVTMPEALDPELEAFLKSWTAGYDPRTKLK